MSWDFDHGIAGISTGEFVPPGQWTYTLVDTVVPTVATLTPAAGATTGLVSQTEVLFNEAVTGIDAGDLLINGAPASSVTGSGQGPYLFVFSEQPAGAVNFAWASGHGIVDSAATPNAFAGGSWSVTSAAAGPGNIVINEFLAANATSISDEDGNSGDWIEIYNAGTAAVNLVGWSLTTDLDQPDMWIFPSRTLDAGGYLVVFASGKDRKPPVGNLHANFKVNENGGTLALFTPDSPRVATTTFAFYPAQRYDFSYGPQTDGALRYFARSGASVDARPGSANGTSNLNTLTPKPRMSVNRGFFKDPFSLVMSCSDATAAIRYTLNGTEPTAASPSYSAPLAISGTTVVRAAAFGANAVPSATVTHSYIFFDHVFDQASPPYDNPANANDNTNPPLPAVGETQLPVAWGSRSGVGFPGQISNLSPNQVPADYGMDPEIYDDPAKYDDSGVVNNATGKTNRQRIMDGFRELPILAVTLPVNDMFGPAGLYPNSTVKGPQFEKACSLEMVLPNGETAFATTCGIRIHGNASRDPNKCPKHGFKLNFKGDFGAASLDYPLFADSPVPTFDDLILRADFNSSWLHWDGGTQRPKGTRIRDAFCKDTFRAMGGQAGHARYVNLFINGVYWGTYDLSEQENADFAEEYFGGDKDDYDVVEQGGLKGGTMAAYNAMLSINSLQNNANYERMKQFLDVPEFIDYMLLHFYVGHQDWGDDINKNWYAVRKRNPSGTFKYLPWDMENLMWSETVNRVTVSSPASGLHPKLMANPEYRLDFADRVHRNLVAVDGGLQPQACTDRWNKWRGVMADAIAAESARWGDYRRDVHQYSSGPYQLYKWNQQGALEHNRLIGTYFPSRSNTVLTQLRSAGLYPVVNAPQFRDDASAALVGSQAVPMGFLLRIAPTAPVPAGTNSSGTIYYTTDGSDPRVAFSGGVSAGAQTYSGPLTIDSTTRVRARALSGSTWSAMNEAVFTVGLRVTPTRITEIMYNPPVAFGGSAAEFIEVQNVGSTTIDLTGYYFEGIDLLLPAGLTIGPGARLVFASNNAPATFAATYPGVAVAATFGGNLDNSGERLSLIDPEGRTVTSVDFQNVEPWPALPNGQGPSLEVIDPTSNPNDPYNWKSSNLAKGTPGQLNSVPSSPIIEINEVLARNVSAVNVNAVFPAYVELHNPGAAPVAVSGWTLTIGEFKYVLPANTTVAAGAYLLVYTGSGSGGDGLHSGSPGISHEGGQVRLQTNSGDLVDGITFGQQAANLAIGRVNETWTLVTPSPGAANQAAPTAPASNLAINEWLANNGPGESDWIELYNRSASAPVALRGVLVQTDAQLFEIAELSFVDAGGWVQLHAEEKSGPNHLNFKLPAGGSAIALRDATGATLDSIAYSAQSQSVSSGRLPDGTGAVTAFPGSSSPGAANYIIDYAGPVFNEVLARTTGIDWFELLNTGAAAFDLSGYRIGNTNNPTTAWFIPAGTSMAGSAILAFSCDDTQPASTSAGANLNTGFALGDLSGGLYLFNPAGQLMHQLNWGAQIFDQSIGRAGGPAVTLLAAPTRGMVNSSAAALGSPVQLRINEWAAGLAEEIDYVELYNTNALPVALGALYLGDSPSEIGRTRFQIAPLSFIGGSGTASAWAVWQADGKPGSGFDHLNFSLDNNGEYLRLSANDADLSVLDAVSFGIQSMSSTEGRILDGGAVLSGLAPSPGRPNILPPAPSILDQPESKTVLAGANVSFAVTAAGSEPLTYQWRFNGVDIPGETNSTLTRNSITLA
ncbi:MAG: lamin tail domain-containing protein, partial [Chthoniobacteraceae bacterium]